MAGGGGAGIVLALGGGLPESRRPADPSMILRFLAMLLVAFLLFAVLVTVLWHLIGPWTIAVVLGLVAGGILAGWLARGKLAQGVLSIPFRAKGAALRGAAAEFHSVRIVGGEGDRLRLCAEVTVNPAAEREGPFRHWEVGELMLVPRPARGRGPDRDLDDCETEEVLAWDGAEFSEPEFDKVPGPLRVRITGTLPGGTRHVALRYYFEVFGEGTVRAPE